MASFIINTANASTEKVRVAEEQLAPILTSSKDLV
jgi:hypothetical protein